MEIGSLSSCFSNGFKWLYLPFSLLRTNSSKLNILTRTFISSFLSSSTSPCISPINNWIKMLITIHSDPISELRYYDSFNMLFWERQDASLMWMPFNTIFLILAAIFLIPSFFIFLYFSSKNRKKFLNIFLSSSFLFSRNTYRDGEMLAKILAESLSNLLVPKKKKKKGRPKNWNSFKSTFNGMENP